MELIITRGWGFFHLTGERERKGKRIYIASESAVSVGSQVLPITARILGVGMTKLTHGRNAAPRPTTALVREALEVLHAFLKFFCRVKFLRSLKLFVSFLKFFVDLKFF